MSFRISLFFLMFLLSGALFAGPVTLGKWGDVASVYLNLATLRGRTFDEVVVEIYDDDHMQFRYTFGNVVFSSYTSEMATGGLRVFETLGLTFEILRVLFVEQNDDQSAGDEHEIEHDIAAVA